MACDLIEDSHCPTMPALLLTAYFTVVNVLKILLIPLRQADKEKKTV